MKNSIIKTFPPAAFILILAAWVAATPASPDAAQDPDVNTIVARTNQVAYYQGKDGKAKVSMTIVDAQGRERNRQFTILRRDALPPGNAKEKYDEDEYTGDQKFYIYFHRPADVEDMVYLVWKQHEINQDDDRWLYLPDLDLVKRIAASDERTSFVGSHFYYEDVSGRNPNEDTHELEQTTDTYYILKNTPKDAELVDFAYFKMWIHKESYIPVQTSYYDAQDKEYRRYTVLNVKNIQGYLTVTRAEMQDLQTGGKTVINYNQVEYNPGLPVEIFENYQRYLRNPPMKYLR